MITTDDWREFFPPTGEGIRPDQEKVVNFVLNRLAEGVPNVWGEGPTGVGKSFAAYAIALYCAIAGMRQLHSSRHYPCPEEGTCDLGRSSELIWVPVKEPVTPIPGYAAIAVETPTVAETVRQIRCRELEYCPYLLARAEFQAAPVAVTNLSYGLTCARYGHDFVASDLVFIDESHTLADHVCALYEVRVRLNTVKKPPVSGGEIAWVQDSYLPDLERRVNLVEQEIRQRTAWNLRDPELVRLDRILSQLKAEAHNLRLVTRGDWSDWVVTATNRELTCQLIWARKMAPALLDFLAPRRVLMSATLLEFEVQAKWLGVSA